METALDLWMQSNGRDDKWLADQLDCHHTTAWRIRTGRGRPSATRAFTVERITRGKVKALTLLTSPLIVADEAKAA